MKARATLITWMLVALPALAWTWQAGAVAA